MRLVIDLTQDTTVQPSTLSPVQAQEIMAALNSNSVPSLEWFEERMPGITQELVEHLLDTALKIKTIIDNP